MLYTRTVSNKTLELLKQMMQDQILANFVLVGGTALSLQIGHRISIDLDLFSINPFDANQLGEYLIPI
jgi:predicted nucleotidyltransferase component of viral defense system